jgi:predicted kinase
MVTLLLVQMSGAPGAGKSTVARAIGRRTGAAVLDHDVVKSALLGAGVAATTAGQASYQTLLALARSLLDQGVSVVLDSPCYYQELLDAGLRLARETGACYRYVECAIEDLAALARRLRERPRLPSQVPDLAAASARATTGATLAGEALFREWIDNMKRPAHSYLRVDTARPLADCLAAIFAFLEECPPGAASSTVAVA